MIQRNNQDILDTLGTQLHLPDHLVTRDLVELIQVHQVTLAFVVCPVIQDSADGLDIQGFLDFLGVVTVVSADDLDIADFLDFAADLVTLGSADIQEYQDVAVIRGSVRVAGFLGLADFLGQVRRLPDLAGTRADQGILVIADYPDTLVTAD